MATKKLDHIVICDTADIELAEMLGDWLDTNLKTVNVVSYDSTEHLQFPVQTAQALKRAKSVVLCLTDNFMPLRFPLPQFQSCIADDPDCTKGKVLAVAMQPLTETEVTPMISIIDSYSGELSQNRRRFIERATAATAPAKKRAARKSPPQAGTTITQTVGKARDVLAAGRDIHVSAKHITRTEFTPDERHITSEQAVKIKSLVDDLAEMDAAAGKDKGRSYQKWWKMFNNSFKITTYRELPREQFSVAVSFLQQAKARSLPKIRRKDNGLWRRKHYQTIFGIARNVLRWTDEQIHDFASRKLGKTVVSLADLGERDLERLVKLIRTESKKR